MIKDIVTYNGKSINKKFWVNLRDKEFNEFVNSIYDYYRKVGFPYINLTEVDRRSIMKKLVDFDSSKVLDEDVIKQYMVGLNLAWHYFPYAWKIRVNGVQKTPLDIFYDDELFRKAIVKRLRFGSNISDNGIRKALMIYGTQRVSNFRPTVAKYIYDTYCDGGVTWDMSSGFGGRLLGALASNRICTYFGTDPNTYKELGSLAKDFEFLGKQVVLSNVGSEEFVPDTQIDLCFTSPPYFNHEMYSEDVSQSYVKYPTREMWLNGYFTKTIQTCFDCLKVGGILAINIANVKTYPNLVDDAVAVINRQFKFIKSYKMSLSNVIGKVKNGNLFKYEPIFIFKKL